jgi:hypothetical protein
MKRVRPLFRFCHFLADGRGGDALRQAGRGRRIEGTRRRRGRKLRSAEIRRAFTASRTGSSSSRPPWGRHLSKSCQSESFWRQPRRWDGSRLKPGSTSGRKPWLSCSNISGKRVPTFTGLRAESTSGPFVPTGYENPSPPRTRLPSIFSPTKPRATRFSTSSTRCGGIVRAPVFAAAQSRSRSSSPTSARSPEAVPLGADRDKKRTRTAW